MTLVLKPKEIYAKRLSEGRLGAIGIADGWKTQPLGELIDVLNGAPFDSNLFNRDGKGKPLIRIRDVGKDDTETWFNGDFDTKYLITSGDVLVGLDGDFRVAEWHGTEALLNQRVCKLIPREDLLDKRFMIYHLAGWLEAIWDETSSITVKHLSSKTIQDIPFPVPPLEEQKRIAGALDEHLSRLDKALAHVRESDDLASQFRRAILEDSIFGAGNFPITKLGAHIETRKSRGIPSQDPGAKYLGLEHVEAHLGSISGFASAREYRSASPVVEAGDLLYGRLRPYLNKVVISPEKVYVSGEFIVMKPSPTLDTSFLKHLLMSPNFLAFTALLDTGDRPRVSWDKIANFEFPLPDQNEQREIAQRIDEALARITSMQAEVAHLIKAVADLRRSMLNAAFSGQLRIG